MGYLNCMLVRLLVMVIMLTRVVAIDNCKRYPDVYPICNIEGQCSSPCNGTSTEVCTSCEWHDNVIETDPCRVFCKYKKSDQHFSGCLCPSWRYGDCCKDCKAYNIEHCISEICSDSPDGVKCTKCSDAYYLTEDGNGCQECPAISHCIKLNCTEPSNTKCLECENNNVFFTLTTDDTKCEGLCSLNNHYCWPGHCHEGFTKNCVCIDGFKSVLTDTETSCQPTQPPEIETCHTVVTGQNGEKRWAKSRTSSTSCKHLDEMYGNFQLTSFSFEMVSSFLLDVSTVKKPTFIHEEHFGITDTTIYIEKKLIYGTNTRVSSHHQLIDTSDSTNTTDTHTSTGIILVNETLTNGEALCIVYVAYGGGYLKHVNTSSEPNKVSSPVPYRKIKGSREICYRFDSAKPQHCLAKSSCHTEPINMQTRVTRSQISTISFDGWFDPAPTEGKKVQASGIESYQVTVNEVPPSKGNLNVGLEPVFTKKVYESESVLSCLLNLTSNRPKLYSITLEVKDIAENTRQARRFMLYDNTSYIETWPEKHVTVTSASKQSNFTWQTNHHDICLSWKDYFFNQFYMDNELLNPIHPSGQISGIYEQLSGVLPVSGTPNVYGITKFVCSASVSGGIFSTEFQVHDVLNQTFCNDFNVKDGQTYTLQVRAIDIAYNTFSAYRTVHIDRSAPHINNIWLRKDGYHTLFVHHMTELSTMQLYFEALDPHSGIRNVHWTFGITDLGIKLTSGFIGIKTIPEPSCSKNVLECYCPDVGKCEFFNYTVPLNELIAKNKHKGNHNRNYYFTVKITNHAFLTNSERIDILVDESPPEHGVIYEGPTDSNDIDYISDNSFVVHWHGFIDHESGIRSYRIGLARRCLGQLELYNFTTVPDNMFYAEVPFTETSIRMPANFTGKRYVSMIALNNAMEPSKSVCSDGVTRDLSPPQLRNVTLEHASWSERVACHNGEPWHFLSSLSKVRLHDTPSCVKLCSQISSGSEYNQISEMLPTKVGTNGDRYTSEFMCRTLQIFSKDTVVYLPNNHINLRWEIDEDVSQLEDFYVGIGTHPSEANLPRIYGYQSTARKKHFKRYHKGISSNDLFFIFIKVVNKAGLEKISILGPILIDETPPLKQRLPEILVTDEEIIIGWENDTFYDMEQSEQISSAFFQFGHDGNAVTPLLHWQLHVSEPCPQFSGGCLKYPLTKLQSFDTDLGFLFYINVYVYNNAGHALKVTTETFRLPSRYPPGHAIVYDVDPVLEGNLQDTDIHFTPETRCFRSSGFKHHQSISIEIGVSSGNMIDDIVPLTSTNVSNKYCLKSTNIKFDITYYAMVRASCSGGVTTSFSNGVKILSENYLIKHLKVDLGEDCSNERSSTLVPHIQNTSSEITFTFSVNVGMPYIVNIPFDNNFVLSTNDGILANDTRKGHHYSFISFIENPTITISSWTNEYHNTDIHLCPFTEYQNTKRKSVHWYYQGINTSFGLTYEFAFIRSDDNSQNNPVRYIVPFTTNENRLTADSDVDLEMNATYKWAVRQCSKVRCLQPVYSMDFHVDKINPVGNILTAIVNITNDAGCSEVTLEWTHFQSGSKITFYQWVISKDANANFVLTPWMTKIANESGLHKVTSCVVLPVYHYSTMFICVRAFAESGNRGHVCEILSFGSLGRYVRNPVYDFDVHSDFWKTVLKALSSSNLGTIYTDFHDNELNFGKASTRAAGVILQANERNIIWYLMLSKLVPDSCEQSKDCKTSKVTRSGYVVFSQDEIKSNTIYYICAFSNATVVEREYFSETLDEINSCSDGFVVDNVAPKPGKIYVRSKQGFLTNMEGIEVTWNGFIENVDAVKFGYVDRIKKYSLAIGSSPKQDDIRNYTDVSLAKRMVLNDIKVTDGSVIYFSVKAEDHAGLTCTAVSKEFMVDTTPPVVGIISKTRDNIYRPAESYITSNTITVSLDGFSDNESGIDFFEIGVGTRPYFSDVIIYSRYDENNVVLYLEDTDLIDGHTYYIIARAVNHAGLKSSFAQKRMTVDRSPPTGGHVLEGHWTLEKDTNYQSDTNSIHGHWKGFDDVHSGILNYRVGLGTQPYHDDIEPMVDVGLAEDQTWNNPFHVGQKYFITVEACNGAGVCQMRSSNGIVLDNSPPISGLVRIGSDLHQKYQSHLSSVHVHWAGFEDPQSGIDHYTMCVGEEKGTCNILPEFSCLLNSNIIKTGLNLPQRTDLYATVTAYNRVGMNVSKTSDAFRVDATPPVLTTKPTFLLDYNNVDGSEGQWEKSVLRIYWNSSDLESPIVSHDVSLITHHEGHTPVENLHLGPENKLTISLNGKNWLHNGDRYIASVTACNQAGLCTSASSEDLLIDATPPHSGGFKQPMFWANLNNSLTNLKSKVTLTWYGFFDQESGIRKYFLTVSRSYSGNELTDGAITFLPETNKSDHVHYVYLTDVIRANDLLFLTIWAENNVGLNSSVTRVSVNALASLKSVNVCQMKGSLELEKHSCDIHFCNKDCTCAVVGKPCVEVNTNKSCKQINGKLEDSRYPRYKVFGGLNDIPSYISASSACLSGRWNIHEQENSSFAVKRFEWSAGIVNQPVGEGVYNLKLENPWQDIGVRNKFVYCLPTNKSLLHSHEYVIYVRAWYSFEEYAVFESDPIMIDQTAPAVRRGRAVLDSNEICSSDFDIIDWADTITACWNGVFNEQQGRITYYSVSLGTTPLADDTFTGTNVGLATNITLRNITLSHGTKYFFSVSAYNNVGLYTSSTSDGFIIDMDNPTTGIVFNSLDHKDRLFQSSFSNLSISWHGFQDDFSGIRNYYAAVVDDPYHYTHVVNFTNVGLKTKFTFKNMQLKHGKTYYGLVKAMDNIGHVSKIAISKGITIDTTPPKQYACQKYTLLKQEIGHIQSNNDNIAGGKVNLTMNRLYLISGTLTNISIYQPRLILHIDRFHITLPLALNHTGVYSFEYRFLALYSGMYNVTVEAYNIKDARVALALSECDEMTEDDNTSIGVRQISLKDISVNVVILDKESQIQKVLLGAGTNPGGFQVKELSPIHHRNNHGLIFTDVPHGSSVYVTVIAENQAGLQAIFKAEPITIDHTAPVITNLQGSIESLQIRVSGQLEYFTIVRAQWKVSDKESGMKFCFCYVGHEPDMHDVQETWLSQTDKSCESEMLVLQHGERVYLNLECVNTVEISSKTSTFLVASYAEPTAESATLEFIPVNDESSMYTSTVKDNVSVQSNRSCLRLKWDGFNDPSGISSYQYRILKGHAIFMNWTMTNRQIITIEKTDLTVGHYMAEVRALNIGNRTSNVAMAKLIVVGKPPGLTGRSMVISRQGNTLHMDWSDVFGTEPDVPVPLSYSVMIGTRPGYTDIFDLSYTSAHSFDLKIPESTIITPNLKELCIQVICVYATGRRNEYATTFDIE